MTTTKSPLWRCGVKVGLCLPRKICAICDARRPSTWPSASMIYQFGSSSEALALYVFFIVHNSKRTAFDLASPTLVYAKLYLIINCHQSHAAFRGSRITE